jgi:hypothetical protein
MSTFAVTNSGEIIDSVNYLLSNLNTGNATGNVSVPTGTLIANSVTGEITQFNTVGEIYGYINQYVNLRYANNSSGTSGFSTVPTNSLYFGVYNSATPTPSANPAAYQWREVAGGFGTTKTIYYSAIGGRQVLWAAASSPPSSNYVISVANVAIDLDVVTTAAGTPGERGPIAMAYVVTTADPNTATSAQLTGWFESARDNLTPPIGTGLTPPVAGDTATFIYGAGVGTPSGTFSYNGSVWNLVVGQVISGNVIVDNSLPAAAIVPESITGNRIAANTITGNTIQVSTITGNLIAANTITGNTIQASTITGDRISVNTIEGNNIAGDTITGNKITSNTITATNIQTATITATQIAAGTITANNIAANTITANNISTSYLYTGNIVSFGASIGNTSSPGYWLDYISGDARFGGNVSIGANLTVSGLITTGALIANTVSTTTVLPSGVSSGFSNQATGPTYTGNTWPRSTYVTANAQGNLTAVANQTGLFVYPNIDFTFSGNIVSPGGGVGSTAYMPVFIDLYNGNSLVNSYGENIYIPTSYPGNWTYTVTPDWTAFYISNYAGANITMQIFVQGGNPNSQYVYIQSATVPRATLVLQSLKR